MLFLYLIAAMSVSTGWMTFWAIMGIFFSERPSLFFVAPLVVALAGEAQLGVMVVIATWIILACLRMNKASVRSEERIANETRLAAIAAGASGQNTTRSTV